MQHGETVPRTAMPVPLSALVDWCRARPVRLCVLFGSQATGRVHANSDVDLAIWTEQPLAPREKLRWIGELTELLARSVSLVLVTPDLDPVLGFEIVRDGKVVFEREAGLWQAQSARLWHLYNDSLPFRRAAREQLRTFAEGCAVARDVLLRKLLYLRQLLTDLEPFRSATRAEVEREHYKIERLFERLVMAASDLIFHLLREQNVVPESYRDGFRLAGERGLLPADLAERLQDAAGMRNVIVHLYEQIDYALLHRSIEPHLDDFGQFVAHFATYLDEEPSD